MNRMVAIGAAAYGLVALITFGHCAAASEKETERTEAACKAKGQSLYCEGAIEVPPLNGITAAVLWPLYWSWELQE